MPEPASAPDPEADPARRDPPGPVRREGRVGGRPAVWYEGGRPDGPTLLLLHGGGADQATISWSLALGAFPERRVVAPDLPGYGGTGRLGRRYTIENLASWVREFVQAVDVAPGAVAGVSMGGAAAIQLALDAPERVRALVPVAAFALGGPSPLRRTLWLASRMPLTPLVYGAVALSDRGARRAMRNVFADPGRVAPAVLADVRAAARTQLRTGSFIAFMRAETTWQGFRTDLSRRLPEIACPTLFVHGTRDELVPARASERAARLVPRGRLALIEDAGHLPMRETPDAFHEAVRAFLASLD